MDAATYRAKVSEFVKSLNPVILALFAGAAVDPVQNGISMRTSQLTRHPKAFAIIKKRIWDEFPHDHIGFSNRENEILITPGLEERRGKILQFLKHVCSFAFVKFHEAGREEFAKVLRSGDTATHKDSSLLGWLETADFEEKLGLGGKTIRIKSGNGHPFDGKLASSPKELEKTIGDFLEKNFPKKTLMDDLSVKVKQNGGTEIIISCLDPKRAKWIKGFFESFKIVRENPLKQNGSPPAAARRYYFQQSDINAERRPRAR